MSPSAINRSTVLTDTIKTFASAALVKRNSLKGCHIVAESVATPDIAPRNDVQFLWYGAWPRFSRRYATQLVRCRNDPWAKAHGYHRFAATRHQRPAVGFTPTNCP